MARRRWSGTAATVVVAAAAGLLLTGVWTATLFVPDPRPPTVAAAKAAVTDLINRIDGTLPAEAVRARHEESTPAPCPKAGLGDQATVIRTIEIEPGMDRVAWAANLDTEFPESEGWVIRTTAVGSRDHLRIRLVGKSLIPLTITTGGDADGGQVTMRAVSECSQAAPD